jgi:hypothetical protein
LCREAELDDVGSGIYASLQTEVVEEQAQIVSVESFRELRNSLLQQRIRQRSNAAFYGIFSHRRGTGMVYMYRCCESVAIG